MACQHDIIETAKAICRCVTDYDCVMDEKPDSECTAENCQMVRYAIEILNKAQDEYAAPIK